MHDMYNFHPSHQTKSKNRATTESGDKRAFYTKQWLKKTTLDDDVDDDVDDDDDVVVVERALSHLSAQPTLPPLCGATGGQTTLHTAKLHTAKLPNCFAHCKTSHCKTALHTCLHTVKLHTTALKPNYCAHCSAVQAISLQWV